METKDVLNEFLLSLLDGLREAGAFVKDQLPLVLSEYVTWGIVEGVIGAIACAIGIFILCRIALRWAYPKAREIDAGNGASKYSDSTGYWVVSVLSILGSAGLLVGVCAFTMQAVKAAVAPRVYLLEELSKLIK